MIQLELFEETTEQKMMRQIKELNEKYDRIRKGQYAKIGHLAKMYEETKSELNTLKTAICRNELHLISQ